MTRTAERASPLARFFGSSPRAQRSRLVSHFESIFDELRLPWSVVHLDADNALPLWKINSRLGDVYARLSADLLYACFYFTIDPEISRERCNDDRSEDGYDTYLEDLLIANTWGISSRFALHPVHEEWEPALFELAVESRFPAREMTRDEVESAMADLLERVSWYFHGPEGEGASLDPSGLEGSG